MTPKPSQWCNLWLITQNKIIQNLLEIYAFGFNTYVARNMPDPEFKLGGPYLQPLFLLVKFGPYLL